MNPIEQLAGQVVGWLRAGYPGGIPPEDSVALLEVLRRKLTDGEIEIVAGKLAASSQEDEHIHPDSIRDMLRSHTLQTASEADVRRVSALLAAAGWPLAEVSEPDDPPTAPRVNPARRFVDWIRLGYPGGVPVQDYPPLLALLHRRLPDEEVDQICQALLMAGIVPAGRVDVGVEITKSVDDLPKPEEISRVLDRLQAVGWPVSEGDA